MAQEVLGNRGLSVVVETTREAEFDFASRQLTVHQVDRISESLKTAPVSPDDQFVGAIRIRKVLESWEVAFLITMDEGQVVVLVLALDFIGTLEPRFERVLSEDSASLPSDVAEQL